MKLCPLIAAQVRPLSTQLHLPFHISQGSVELLENVLIVLRDADGRVGLGEAAPFPVLTHDTQQTVLPACRAIVDQLSGLTPAAALDRLVRDLWPEFSQTPTALAGVEIALWDLHARQLGLPLAALWGRAFWSQAETDITLPRLSPSEVPVFYQQFADHHFPYYKVKVGGGSVADDVERVMALRNIVGASLRISLDGNQGLSEASALSLCETLVRHQVVPLFFEQPLPAADLDGMARLARRLPIPVCADESVQTIDDAFDVLHRSAAGMVNLKFMKSGVSQALQIAELCHRKKIPLMIGGMVESEIAMTAALHAVCGTGIISVCDLDTPFFLTSRFTKHSPYHGKSAMLQLPEGDGLGISLCDELFADS